MDTDQMKALPPVTTMVTASTVTRLLSGYGVYRRHIDLQRVSSALCPS